MRVVKFVGVQYENDVALIQAFESSDTEATIEKNFIQFIKNNGLDPQRSYWEYC